MENASNNPLTSNGKPIKKEIELTEKNWLMLRYLREGKRIKEAYTLAGYDGSGDSCYKMYHDLKGKLKEIVEADGFNKTRLAIEMEKLISLPLEESKKEVTLTEKLKAIRLANQILSEDAQKAPQSQFTMIIINNEQDKGNMPIENGNVVDVKEIEE